MITVNDKVKILITAFAVSVLVGCATNNPAPVVDLTKFKPDHYREISDSDMKHKFRANAEELTSHTVRAGETLYSIAWRYSLDYRDLAKLNNVKANTIYPGQKLNLVQSATILQQPDQTKPFSSQNLLAAINKEVLNKPTIQTKELSKMQAASQKTLSMSASRKISVKNHEPTKIRRSTVRKSTVKRAPKLALAEQGKPVKQWIWPVNGKVVSKFSPYSNMNKGLDIVAKSGSPVRATAEGRVVYSGNGLRGYGQLVIIKHNEQFLSAYAHNKKIHVEENEVVKAGQRIADLGDTGSDTDKLHFEIRLKGKPVDPLNYLPKSGLM
jgi:lipoprotein NlpD